MSAHLTLAPFDPHSELAAFTAAETRAGALASFVGLVRGAGIDALILEHFPGFTEAAITAIETDGRARFDVLDTLVIHRAGEMAPGEPIVLVAALSKHRKQALACVDYLMDRLKTEAPFWKRERRVDGEHWIEPRSEDYTARAAWEKTE
jgi:molybdopterin synthase catalytic subunit